MEKLLSHLNVFARVAAIDAELKRQHEFNVQACKAIYLISTALNSVKTARDPLSPLYGDQK